MRQGIVWCILTEKRLLKKISYLLVLLLVPALMSGMKLALRQESGMASIGLCCEQDLDGLSGKVISEITEEKSVLRYILYDTEAEAESAVREGVVSAAWIFPGDLAGKLTKMAEKGRISPVISVVEREDDVTLILTREVLCSHVYPQLVGAMFREFCDGHLQTELTREELDYFLEQNKTYSGLFQERQPDGTALEEEHYLLSPMRGLLAVWVVISGFAAVLYHKRDEKIGVYEGSSAARRRKGAFLMETVVLVNSGVCMLAACAVLDVLTDPLTEVTRMILFLIETLLFCHLCGKLFRRMESLGAVMPILVLVMVVLCPLFFDVRSLFFLRWLLPPYFYLRAIDSTTYIGFMVCYIVAGGIICTGAELLGKRN